MANRHLKKRDQGVNHTLKGGAKGNFPSNAQMATRKGLRNMGTIVPMSTPHSSSLEGLFPSPVGGQMSTNPPALKAAFDAGIGSSTLEIKNLFPAPRLFHAPGHGAALVRLS